MHVCNAQSSNAWWATNWELASCSNPKDFVIVVLIESFINDIMMCYIVISSFVFGYRWVGLNRRFNPLNWMEIERKRHNKVQLGVVLICNLRWVFGCTRFDCIITFLSFQERTLSEHQRLLKGILKGDERRRKRIKEAGIDYECPELVK